MISLITGIAASMAHVITGPDHLAAVTPLAIDSQKKSWWVGFAWGVGHTIGMLAIGGLFVLLKGFIHIDKITGNSEIIVGIMLILIGLWAIWKVLNKKQPHRHIHFHIHRNSGFLFHIHRHFHDDHEKHPHDLTKNHRQNAGTALLVGIIHGCSGFSHLLAVLPALALPSELAAILYLSGFAIGTIIAMVSVSVILGTIAYRSSMKKKSNFLFGFSLGGGILAVGVGIFWIISSL
jgi:ABC-type nickel/cobalt efflux system permease component RcnA